MTARVRNASRHQVIDVVEVLRKRIRGHALTAQEAAALAAHSRPVKGSTILHAQIKRELAQREREERARRARRTS
jgi:hypothetical protein